MDEDEKDQTEEQFAAFISYRHKPLDTKAARLIQKRIESYMVPKEYREKAGGKSLGKVFRDEDELRETEDLPKTIYDALDNSRFMVVICTPETRDAPWIKREITYFLKNHGRNRLLIILVDGKREESIPAEVFHDNDDNGNVICVYDPLPIDIVGQRHTISRRKLRKEIVSVYAALLEIPFDALWQREHRRKTKRLATFMGISMAILMFFVGMLYHKNSQIKEKEEALREQLSAVLVEKGRSQLEGYDVKGCLQSVLEALPEEHGQTCDPKAEALLNDVLCTYQQNELQRRIIYSQNMDIVAMTQVENGKCVVLADTLGYVRCISIADGAVKWETLCMKKPGYEYAETKLIVPANHKMVLVDWSNANAPSVSPVSTNCRAVSRRSVTGLSTLVLITVAQRLNSCVSNLRRLACVSSSSLSIVNLRRSSEKESSSLVLISCSFFFSSASLMRSDSSCLWH